MPQVNMSKKRLERGRGKSKPLYDQIQSYFRSQIENGVISVGDSLPSASSIVCKWEVDYRTVNSALDILEKEGLICRKPGRGKGAVVVRAGDRNCYNASIDCSICFPRWTGSRQFYAISKGIEKFAEKHAVNFSIIDVMENMENYISVLTNVPSNINGLIVYPWDAPDYREAVVKAITSGLKMVFVDRVLLGLNVGSVSADHFGGAYQATKHLIDAQKCPVYFLGNPNTPSSGHLRYRGWQEAMREYDCNIDIARYTLGLPLEEAATAVMKVNDWMQLDSPIISQLFESREEKYCIFAMNDDAGALVYIVAEQKGMKIGKDVFVVGFGDNPYCENLNVPMTSIAQFDEKVGYEAAFLLYQKIKYNQCAVNKIIPTKLMIRASSIGC
ncbi:MAG: GntR family transcriptional regulator [Phycisphaerales bacterium]